MTFIKDKLLKLAPNAILDRGSPNYSLSCEEYDWCKRHALTGLISWQPNPGPDVEREMEICLQRLRAKLSPEA